MNKVFSTPTEVFYGQFNGPQLKAINFVEQKLLSNEFNFKPPYEIAQYSDLIGTLLNESNWSLQNVNGTWKILAKI